jgi:hypothetical protein
VAAEKALAAGGTCNLKEDFTHPADELAVALDRVASLIALLGGLYNTKSETFSGGNAFVAQSMVTATSLVDDARKALSDLHFGCDLTLLDHPDRGDILIKTTVTPTGHDTTTDNDPVAQGEELETVLPTSSEPQEFSDLDQAQPKQDEFAKNYLELLKKLTAAEVFAAEQQALSAPGATPELLPLLRSLREDLQKIHNAA